MKKKIFALIGILILFLIYIYAARSCHVRSYYYSRIERDMSKAALSENRVLKDKLLYITKVYVDPNQRISWAPETSWAVFKNDLDNTEIKIYFSPVSVTNSSDFKIGRKCEIRFDKAGEIIRLVWK